MSTLYTDSERLEDELDDAEGINDGTNVIEAVSDENTPLYTPGELIASAEARPPNRLQSLNEPSDTQEEVLHDENRIDGFISNIGGSDGEHIGDDANYRPNYDAQDNAGGYVGENETENDEVGQDEAQEEEDDEAGENDADEEQEEEEIYDEGKIEDGYLQNPVSKLALPVPPAYEPSSKPSSKPAASTVRVPRIPTVISKSTIPNTSVTPNTNVTQNTGVAPNTSVAPNTNVKNLVPVKKPVIPSSVPTNLAPITTRGKKAAGRSTRKAATFTFPDETDIDTENLIQREPAEDYESYLFRERYTLVLDDLPEPWGQLRPSIKIALGFMATKKARYGVIYDAASEALLSDIEAQMKIHGITSEISAIGT